MSRPLEGIRVADFSWVGAGPLTTRLLALYGADVIKVESNAKIDGLRLSPPFRDGVRGINRSGYFADRNPDKRSMLLNLKTETGRDLARRLVGRCDIVANNFSPGVMERFGLGWEDLRDEFPHLIHLNMSMHGATGPERQQLGFGLTIGAIVGLHHLCGVDDRPPVGTGTNFPDHIPNPTHAAVAVLAALLHRRRTGLGQCVDLAQTEPTISVLGVGFVEHFANGVDPPPSGNAHPEFAPHGVFPCRDGRWIALSVRTGTDWEAVRRVLGLTCPPDWDSVVERRRQRRAVDRSIRARTERRDVQELVEELVEAGVAAGVLRDARDLVTDHPQLAYRGHWARPPHPEMGESVYNEAPLRMSRSPGSIRRAAPLLGEHTHEICRDLLGLTDAEIAELEKVGVLW